MPHELPEVVPPDSVLGDAERRAKLEEASLRAAKITATLATVTKLVPGPAGKLIGTLAVGVQKAPETGKLRPGSGFALNFAPSPVGFLDPTAVALPRNWWLPSGATEFIPQRADSLGLGLPEQRAEDITRRAAREADIAAARVITADAVVGRESNETLEALAAGRGGFTRAGFLRATSDNIGTATLEARARAELDRRAAAAAAAAAAMPSAEEQLALARASAAAAEEGQLIETPRGESGPSGNGDDIRRVDRLNSLNPPDP